MCIPSPPKPIVQPEARAPEASAELELAPDSPGKTRQRQRQTGAAAILTTPLSLPSLPASGGAVTGAPRI